MEKTEWRKLIAQHLKVKPLHHGQVFTEEIAISSTQNQVISQERKEDLTRSLTQYKSNLIPLILRRTDQYGENYEYEVIYGADWCIIAQELDIEKLWAWVFDLNEDQALAIQAEMEELANISHDYLLTPEIKENENKLIVENSLVLPKAEVLKTEKIEENKIIFNQEKIENLIETKLTNILAQQFNHYFEKLEFINQKIDQINTNLLTSELVESIIDRKFNSIQTQKPLLELSGISPANNQISHTINYENNYQKLTVADLKKLAKERKIPRYSTMKRAELILVLKQT